MSVHSGDDVEVCGVRDAAVHDQHLVIDHCGQRQPAEDLLQKLQDLLAMELQDETAVTSTAIVNHNWTNRLKYLNIW